MKINSDKKVEETMQSPNVFGNGTETDKKITFWLWNITGEGVMGGRENVKFAFSSGLGKSWGSLGEIYRDRDPGTELSWDITKPCPDKILREK